VYSLFFNLIRPSPSHFRFGYNFSATPKLVGWGKVLCTHTFHPTCKVYNVATLIVALENVRLQEVSGSKIAQSDSTVAARKNVCRKTSTALGVINVGLSLFASSSVYLLLVPFVLISAILMMIGSILVWTKESVAGAVLILVGGIVGGYIGLPSLLWTLLAPSYGRWVFGLPMLPLGLIIPVASAILALMSRE
jgi:hypothetical protein